jgi:hypothetical protein
MLVQNSLNEGLIRDGNGLNVVCGWKQEVTSPAQ